MVTAFLFAASGVMKVFMFDQISDEVAAFGALPRQVWLVLGIIELCCVVGLIAPGAFRWYPILTVIAAGVLAMENLVFVWVHVQYNEVGAIVMICVLGLLMAFITYGRFALSPIT